MKALLLAISCGLLALPALSQATLSCTGRIVKAPATPCDPTATHMIDCTQVLLKSSTVTLSTWENKVVDLTGNETVGACNIIDVATVANPAYKHTITGTFKLGSTITWKGAGPILSLAVIYLAGDSSFLPLSTFGALFIDPVSAIQAGSGVILFGPYSISATIPNASYLIGGKVWSQSGYVVVTGTPTGALLNAECFTVIQ